MIEFLKRNTQISRTIFLHNEYIHDIINPEENLLLLQMKFLEGYMKKYLFSLITGIVGAVCLAAYNLIPKGNFDLFALQPAGILLLLFAVVSALIVLFSSIGKNTFSIKKYLFSLIISIVGFVCVMALNLIPTKIVDGRVIEPFFLGPLGVLLIAVGIISAIIVLIVSLAKSKKKK